MPPVGATNEVKLKSHNQEDYCDWLEATTFKYLRTLIDHARGCCAEVARQIGTGGKIFLV